MAKQGRPLVVTDPTLLIRRDNERLVMVREKSVVMAMPLREISRVALHGPVTVTGAALAGLLDAGIDVTLHSSAGRWRGTITSSQGGNVYLLLAQVDAWNHPDRRLAVVRALIAGKVAGQRQIVRRAWLDRSRVRCEAAARRLGELEAQCWREGDLDALRGVEGVASAEYFGVFDELLAEGWSFPGRVRRPPTDPVNAMLSFGYTLACGEVAKALFMRGFDTRIGLLHGLRYGRESLVLDMVEEFRAAMVDRFVLKRINSSGIETACGRGTRRACARGAKPLPDIQRD
jgi:CRISPR-associated protein Cas1